ncbi:hypothetical protein F8388_011536 [Cannabis sativa]|uniref:Ycf2 N-terminal domain-containing protein n=1 Tax=Cannabis sativa TaxID=3483 RepID=A0A7J6DZ54_CANSA|nr:hypothetical protein F8388_011536 [Cannabis sativa]
MKFRCLWGISNETVAGIEISFKEKDTKYLEFLFVYYMDDLIREDHDWELCLWAISNETVAGIEISFKEKDTKYLEFLFVYYMDDLIREDHDWELFDRLSPRKRGNIINLSYYKSASPNDFSCDLELELWIEHLREWQSYPNACPEPTLNSKAILIAKISPSAAKTQCYSPMTRTYNQQDLVRGRKTYHHDHHPDQDDNQLHTTFSLHNFALQHHGLKPNHDHPLHYDHNYSSSDPMISNEFYSVHYHTNTTDTASVDLEPSQLQKPLQALQHALFRPFVMPSRTLSASQ